MKTRINENIKAASFNKEVSESLTQGAACTTTADAANDAVAITMAFYKALCVAVATGYLRPFATVDGMMRHARLAAKNFGEGNYIQHRVNGAYARDLSLNEATALFVENTKSWQKEWKPCFYIYKSSSKGSFGEEYIHWALVVSYGEPKSWYHSGTEQGTVTKRMSYSEGIDFLYKVLFSPNKWHCRFTNPESVLQGLKKDFRKKSSAWLWYTSIIKG